MASPLTVRTRRASAAASAPQRREGEHVIGRTYRMEIEEHYDRPTSSPQKSKKIPESVEHKQTIPALASSPIKRDQNLKDKKSMPNADKDKASAQANRSSDRKRATTLTGGKVPPPSSPSPHAPGPSTRTRTDDAARRSTREPQVTFPLLTSPADELVKPVHKFSLCTERLKAILRGCGYDKILATRSSPIDSCIIRIKNFHWDLTIPGRPSHKGGSHGLTVFDVLVGIQTNLMKAPKPSDYDASGPLAGGIPPAVWEACLKRGKCDNKLPPQASVKMIDWLEGNHYFHGIEATTEAGRWKLLVGKP